MDKNLQIFHPGKAERIWREFRNSDDQLVDPTSPKLEIYAPDGSTVTATATPIKESIGIYYHTLYLATSAPVGVYEIYWQGTINGALVGTDISQYIELIPLGWNTARYMIQATRRITGDLNPANYKIPDSEMDYFLQDGVEDINAMIGTSYTLTITKTSVTFNADPTYLPRRLMIWQTALRILTYLNAETLDNMGSLTLGDISINLSSGTQLRKDTLDRLQNDIDKGVMEYKLQEQMGGVDSIDSQEGGWTDDTGQSGSVDYPILDY